MIIWQERAEDDGGDGEKEGENGDDDHWTIIGREKNGKKNEKLKEGKKWK